MLGIRSIPIQPLLSVRWILVPSLILLAVSFTAAQIQTIGTQGAYPDIQLDKAGNLHLVYGRSGKTYYRMLPYGASAFTPEESTGVGASRDHQKQPDVAIDPKGGVHVLGNSTYNMRTPTGWGSPVSPGVGRDHHMAFTSGGDLWIVYRGYQLSARRKPSGGKTFESPINIYSGGGTDHVYPDICGGSDGTVHVVFRMRVPSNYDCAYLKFDGQKWGTVEWACLNGRSKVEEGPHVALDRNNVPWVAIPEGNLLINNRTGGTWTHTIENIGTGHTRSEPTIGVDRFGNRFVAKWGGEYFVYRVSTAKWVKGKLPSTNTDPIGFVDVVATDEGAFMVYEQGKSVNKSVGAGAADLVAVKVLPDGSVVPPSTGTSKALEADKATLSGRAGGVVTLTLNAGAVHARQGYVILASMSGTSPGILLPSNSLLPLNLDLLTWSVFQWMHDSRYKGFTWWFDAQGKAEAKLTVDPGFLTQAVGMKYYFAYVNLPVMSFPSNPITLLIEP